MSQKKICPQIQKIIKNLCYFQLHRQLSRHTFNIKNILQHFLEYFIFLMKSLSRKSFIFYHHRGGLFLLRCRFCFSFAKHSCKSLDGAVVLFDDVSKASEYLCFFDVFLFSFFYGQFFGKCFQITFSFWICLIIFNYGNQLSQNLEKLTMRVS